MATETDNFFSRWSRRKLQTLEQPPAPTTAQPDLPEAAAPAAALARSSGDEGASLALPAANGPLQPDAADEPAPSAAAPPPTLDDLALLDRDSSYARFVARDVTPDVRNAAMKKLFADPHFNVMDGLDIYIDDYSKPDPLPPGMLRQMVQSKMLGLFAAEDAADDAAAAAARKKLATPLSTSEVATPTADDGASASPQPQPQPQAGAPVEPASLDSDPTRPGVNDAAVEPLPAADAATPATAPDEDTHLQLQPDHDAGRAGAEAGTGHDAGGQHRRAG